MLTELDIKRGFLYKLLLIKSKSNTVEKPDKKLYIKDSVLGIITIPTSELDLFSDNFSKKIYNVQDCLFFQPKILYKNKKGIFFRGHNKSKISTRNTYLSEDDILLLSVMYSGIDFYNWKLKEDK